MARSRSAHSTALVYVRVSTQEQQLSPPAQRAAIAAFARREKIQILAWYEDLGVSGTLPLEKRPALRAALRELAHHQVRFMIIAVRDRLARRSYEAQRIDRLVEATGGRVLSANGSGNGDSPMECARRQFDYMQAEYESRVASARTLEVMAYKRSRGECTGEAPLGFGWNQDGLLQPDEREQLLILTIASLRRRRYGYRRIATELRRRGFCTRRGKPTTPDNVRRIIFYLSHAAKGAAPGPLRSATVADFYKGVLYQVRRRTVVASSTTQAVSVST